MRWKKTVKTKREPPEWELGFAFVPIEIDGCMVWLELVEYRFNLSSSPLILYRFPIRAENLAKSRT